ncbi:MAG: hypothetical protein U1F76_26215 [Candidatus Competibacteraceae bacterium]
MKHATKYTRRIALIIAMCWAMALVHEASATIKTVATFPIVFTPSGRIQIKARLIGYSAASPITTGTFGGGGFPFLFLTDFSGFQLAFTANDGCGGGGLGGIMNGNATTCFGAATGSFTHSFTYGDILGNQPSVDAWHTYELVWNTAGLPNVSGHKVAVYLDGQLNSTYFPDNFNGVFSGGSGTFSIGFPASQGDDPRNIAFDELRIWNNSDPAQASLVLANSFENQNLISSVGPNGTYVSGSFIESVVGNALSTLVGKSCINPPTISVSGNTATVTVNCNSDIATATWQNLENAHAVGGNPEVQSDKRSAVGVLQKLDPNLKARFGVFITFLGGGQARVDPVFTNLQINTGRSVTQIFADIPQTEHYVAITNGSPGLARLEILFNGRYKAVKLSDNQTFNVDMAAAPLTTQPSAPDTLTLVGTGQTGASAEIVVSDTPPPAVQSQARALSASVVSPDSGTWGPLTKEFEDNSALQVARSAQQQIELHLATALNPATATLPQLYTVQVNNIRVEVRQVVVAKQNPKETTLLLTLPTGTFKAGDAVTVAWERVENAQGQPLVGQVNLIAQ